MHHVQDLGFFLGAVGPSALVCCTWKFTLTKVNVDNKGDLNLSIKWPESSDSKSISKALLSGTDKVEIYLFHPATHTSINRTLLTHTDGQIHNEEFKDLPEGT